MTILPPKFFITETNPGNDVFTVSKFFILVLIPVANEKITDDMQILWSPFVFIKIDLFWLSIFPYHKLSYYLL